MAEKIKIKLDTSQYKSPTQEDINAAKQFILRRNDFAIILDGKIDELLEIAAYEIVTICYKYNVSPKEFVISSQYNEQMMEEIANVMDDLETKILSLINEYSTRVSNNRIRINQLATWITSLGRGNRNLQDTLDEYLYKFMKDIEAAVAAMRFADVQLADAITKVKTYLHTVYTMPEMTAAFKYADDFNATYIRSRGVAKGNVGISNNGSTNITNMAKITLHMAWMRSQAMDFREQGAVGYYQLRGSNYNCDLCDSETGFHYGLADIFVTPLPHPRCCCYRIPIFIKS